MQAQTHPWVGSGLVPVVNPADVKVMWDVRCDAETRHPGELVATANGVIPCSPGADMRAVSYRTAMLSLLFHICKTAKEAPAPKSEGAERFEKHVERLEKWQTGDRLDVLFKVIATIPLHWLDDEGPSTLPFDIEEFIRQVEQESA